MASCLSRPRNPLRCFVDSMRDRHRLSMPRCSRSPCRFRHRWSQVHPHHRRCCRRTCGQNYPSPYLQRRAALEIILASICSSFTGRGSGPGRLSSSRKHEVVARCGTRTSAPREVSPSVPPSLPPRRRRSLPRPRFTHCPSLLISQASGGMERPVLLREPLCAFSGLAYWGAVLVLRLPTAFRCRCQGAAQLVDALSALEFKVYVLLFTLGAE